MTEASMLFWYNLILTTHLDTDSEIKIYSSMYVNSEELETKGKQAVYNLFMKIDPTVFKPCELWRYNDSGIPYQHLSKEARGNDNLIGIEEFKDLDILLDFIDTIVHSVRNGITTAQFYWTVITYTIDDTTGNLVDADDIMREIISYGKSL